MRVLVQKTSKSFVTVDSKIVGEIGNGLTLLVGFTEGDDIDTIKWMVRKVLNLRIFEDENNIMNKSLLDVKGEVLSISQFTLYGDVTKGNRPSYIKALGGEQATILYDKFNEELSKEVNVQTGIFGADMDVSIINVGPTTILLER